MMTAVEECTEEKDKNEIKVKTGKHEKRHLTNGNCSPPFGGSGSKKLQSAQAPLCSFSPPHFVVAGLAAQALIRNRKTSVT